MGFADRWVSLIMKYVTTISCSVNLNGSNGVPFTPSRGLRQGEPPSPYMFLICAKCLSSILCSAKATGSISGTKDGRYGVPITHLFFTDDSFLFGQSTLDEAAQIKALISSYEHASGQLVNYNKSSIFFSGNVPSSLPTAMSSLFDVRISTNPE
ncbi:hypothetical protein V6N13_142398 [Hibiscus sabdariffa]